MLTCINRNVSSAQERRMPRVGGKIQITRLNGENPVVKNYLMRKWSHSVGKRLGRQTHSSCATKKGQDQK